MPLLFARTDVNDTLLPIIIVDQTHTRAPDYRQNIAIPVNVRNRGAYGPNRYFWRVAGPFRLETIGKCSETFYSNRIRVKTKLQLSLDRLRFAALLEVCDTDLVSYD